VRGDVDLARALEDRTRRRLEANPLLAQERWSTTLGTAHLEFSGGDAAAAYAELTPLLETLAEVPLKPAFVCEVVVLAIDVLVALGRAAEASTLAERHLDRLRASGIAWIAAETDRAEALLLAASGDTESALLRSDRGLEAIRSSGVPLLLGRALLTAGELRRRGRQKALARAALREAVEVFDLIGARIWAEQARSELGRVATRREPGAPLTATERGVVDLVAAGRTNKEIADALFMSVHTVEAHLTRLFRTLGVQSRTELARLVIERTDPRLMAADPDPVTAKGRAAKG
jgi:DNA-binding CsgD family transcriptional regulator